MIKKFAASCGSDDFFFKILGTVNQQHNHFTNYLSIYLQCVFFISTKVFVDLTNLKLFYRGV